MKLLTVRHITTYRYRQPVSFGEHRMMFRPRDSHDQRLIEARLVIEPEPVALRWIHDVFGNCVALARFAGQSDMLRVDSMIRLDHSASNVLDFVYFHRSQRRCLRRPCDHRRFVLPRLGQIGDSNL